MQERYQWVTEAASEYKGNCHMCKDDIAVTKIGKSVLKVK